MLGRLAAATLCLLGLVPAAVAAAESAQSAPPLAQRLVARGDRMEEDGYHSDAIALYTEAIADDPTYAYAYASRCESEWALDKNAIAARDCLRAIALDPASAYAYRQLSLALSDNGDLPGALRAADRAIQIDPRVSYAFAVRCRAEADMDRNAGALSDCSKAISMDPKSIMGHTQRTRVELNMGNDAAGEADATWVIDNHADIDTAWYNRALARLHLKKLPGALYDIGQYIGGEPADGDGYYLKARIELASNHKSAAHEAANEAWRRYYAAKDSAGVTRARSFIASNDLESAESSDLLYGALGAFFIAIGAVVLLAFYAIFTWTLWRVFVRAGLQGPLALLVLVPGGLIVCLALLAFSPWNVRPSCHPERRRAAP